MRIPRIWGKAEQSIKAANPVNPSRSEASIVCFACSTVLRKVPHDKPGALLHTFGEAGLCERCKKIARTGLLYKCIETGQRGVIPREEATKNLIEQIRIKLLAKPGEIVGMDISVDMLRQLGQGPAKTDRR